MPGGPGSSRPRSSSTPRSTCPRPPRPRRCWSRTGSAAARPRSTPTPGTWPPAASWCWPGRPAASAPAAGRSRWTPPTTRWPTPARWSTGWPPGPRWSQDGPGDPRVGITGGSYGGALSLLLAGYDRRVDALAPVITWNDLGQALFPNAATATAAAAGHPGARRVRPGRGVQEGWAGIFFSAGLAARLATGSGRRPTAEAGAAGDDRRGRAPASAAAGARTAAGAGLAPPRAGPAGRGPATCGRFMPAVCAAYTEAATTGRLSPATAELLRRSSPATVTDRITAPTLLVQGEQDTLFGLDQADANARADRRDRRPGQGRLVRRRARRRPDPATRIRDEIGDWFTWYLGRDGALADRRRTRAPASPTRWQSGVRASSRTPTGRTVVAAGLPGPARDGHGGHPGRRAAGRPAGRDQPGRRQPGRDHRAARARRRAGQRRRAADRVHRRAARAVRAVPHRRRSTEPLLVAGRAAGRGVGRPRCPGSRRRPRRCCSPRPTRSTPDGLRTLLGSAVAPMRVRCRPTGRPPGHRDAARRGGADRGRQPAAGVGQHHRPGLREPRPSRRSGRSGSPRRGHGAGGAGRVGHRQHGAARAGRSGSAWCSALALLGWLARSRLLLAPPAGAPAALAPAAAPLEVARPGQDVQGRLQRGRRASRSTSNAGRCSACSAPTAPARPPCCAC